MGKTLSLTYLAWRNWKLKFRDVYSNYKLYGIPYYPIKTINQMDKIRNGFVAMDEFWLSMDARMTGQEQNRIVSNILSESRKRGLTLAFTVQYFKSIDPRVRKITDLIFYPLMNRNNTLCRLMVFKGPKVYANEEPIKTFRFNPRFFYPRYRTEEEADELTDDLDKDLEDVKVEMMYRPIGEAYTRCPRCEGRGFIPKKCPVCGGEGQIKEKELKKKEEMRDVRPDQEVSE